MGGCEHSGRAALPSAIADAKRRQGLSANGRCVVRYEAVQEGYWLERALRDAGVEAAVIDPVSLQVDRRSKRAKTDRLDAEALAEGLLAWCGPVAIAANGTSAEEDA